MKTVPLHGQKAAGRVALVDDADYDLVMQHRWCAKECKRKHGPVATYATANVTGQGRHTTITMHKLITGWRLTDHKDRDGLNNQRSNLRDATGSQNMANKVGLPNTASRFKGVHRFQGAWVASIGTDGGCVYLGRYADELTAARAYDTGARAQWGEFALVNFPDLPDLPARVPPDCIVCGRQVSAAKRTDAKYCSDPCRSKASARAWTERRRQRRSEAA